jgi:Peptidase family M28
MGEGYVVDFRLYRLAFLPALAAVVVMLFSLEPVPAPLEAPISLAGFDGEAAGRTARQIASSAPERTPGSEGDGAIADLVAERFAEIESAELFEQSFSSSFDGDDVQLRNVIATLPGESERRLVLLAPRDSVSGPGAASSAAATAMLVELAENFADASHTKTIVLVSTAGADDGATGAREFAEHYPERHLIDAAVAISQPGALRPQPPFVIPWSEGPQSTAIQLTRTAAATVTSALGRSAGLEGSFGDLLRLALPTGFGEQAPLIERGIDAVSISSAGERPLDPGEDGLESLSDETLARLGGAAQTIVVALDAHSGSPEHGPDAYVAVARNLIPGWSLALLAVTLLLPAGVAAMDGFARGLRRGVSRPLDLGWVIGRSLPFLAALALAYALSIVGLLPNPSFPYDPGRFAVGWRAVVVALLVTAALAGTWYATRPLSAPRRARFEGLAVAAGVGSFATVLAVWLLNPFLALLAVPAAHAWLAATLGDRSVRIGASISAVAVALLPGLVALAWLADRLEVGIALPWHILLMVSGGHLSPPTALLGCLLAGCLVAVVAAALRPTGSTPEPEISAPGPVGGPDRVSDEDVSGMTEPSDERKSARR